MAAAGPGLDAGESLCVSDHPIEEDRPRSDTWGKQRWRRLGRTKEIPVLLKKTYGGDRVLYITALRGAVRDRLGVRPCSAERERDVQSLLARGCGEIAIERRECDGEFPVRKLESAR